MVNPHASLTELTQERYARWLEVGTRLSLLAMIVGFALYIFGVLQPVVPFDKLPSLWHLSADQYVASSGVPVGWTWLAQLHRADMLAVLGVACLALCSLPCLLALVPLFWARGDRIYVVLCIAQAVVLLVSASGWVVAH